VHEAVEALGVHAVHIVRDNSCLVMRSNMLLNLANNTVSSALQYCKVSANSTTNWHYRTASIERALQTIRHLLHSIGNVSKQLALIKAAVQRQYSCSTAAAHSSNSSTCSTSSSDSYCCSSSSLYLSIASCRACSAALSFCSVAALSLACTSTGGALSFAACL
jgi:hypothetical protein